MTLEAEDFISLWDLKDLPLGVTLESDLMNHHLGFLFKPCTNEHADQHPAQGQGNPAQGD